jgi:serine/threonine-protein kinase
MTQTLNDRYVLEEKVGEGGMAVTYRARDLLLNRTVAVKLMREQFTSDPHFVERFRREAQAAARLSHEHIANVYDTGVCQGVYYIVMEFVEGTDLKQRLRRDGALPIAVAISIAAQIAAALDASHRSGLIHRDIKPHNILLTDDGRVKVTDFGIAKLMSDSEDTGVILASVHYVAPEHVRGEATSPATDLYSLGAVLFEMLTGRTVFEGESAMAVAHKQAFEAPPNPRDLRPDIPAALAAIVLRCLEKEPRARYASAAEVRTALLTLQQRPDQEATVVLQRPAALDATAVYQRPTATPAPAAPQPVEASAPPRRGGNGGTIALILLFLFFLGVVGYVGYTVFFKDTTGIQQPSNSAESVQVPDLSTRTADQAKNVLQLQGLQAMAESETSELVEEGKVCRQDPPANTTVAKGATVTFWISDGPTSITMPDVTQMTVEAAARQLRDAGFKGKFQYQKETTTDLPKGQVVRTAPAAGTVLDRKGTVTLVRSDGEPAKVQFTFTPGAAPRVDDLETVYVKIEYERPAGTTPITVWDGTLAPGDPIDPQTLERFENERVVVRILAGKDEATAEEQSERVFGPPAPATPAAPASH